MNKSEKKHNTGFEIAVIGMAGRFPGARDCTEFWENLKNGVESISFFTGEELVQEGIDPGLVENANYIKAKGVLEDYDYFDASFFGYSVREAQAMDPQLRIFQETAWEALEDAGYVPDTYVGLIGLYAGASPHPFWEIQKVAAGEANWETLQFIDKDFMVTQVSYKLNLRGPGLLVQSSCSTSLAAIHQACRALLTGECEIVLAGGIGIGLPQKQGYIYAEGMILAPDGHCRAFDAEAKGVIPGNGSGIVVLKRLTLALRDRDNIYAVIKGSAANNDGGRKLGYTAPSIEGQADVIRLAQRVAKVEPETIGCIEAHGTGTTLGDPIEIEALIEAFNTDKKHFCAVGSVKTNIGHLDAAAGVAGFIKTVLALKHKVIPPSLHFQTPNPKINFENSPFYVVSKSMEWKRNHFPRRAGVSSFGIGGTNIHVILEEAPGIESGTLQDNQYLEKRHRLILLSAKTAPALDNMSQRLATFLEANPGLNLADAAYTLSTGRKHFKHRKIITCNEFSHGGTRTNTDDANIKTFVCGEEDRPIVFMFPGQGSQYIDMGLTLYQTEPLFREEMDRCFEILNPLMGYDIKEILYPAFSPLERGTPKGGGVSQPDINQTEVAQPLLFIVEYALAKLLMHWGIKPQAMIGHSIGEYTAAHLSGVFSLQDAIKLVCLRGQLMQQMPGGAMVSISLPAGALKPLLNKEISLAALNSTSLSVVSGPHRAIDDWIGEMEQKGYETRRLHTSHAFHSTLMEPAVTLFKEKIQHLGIKLKEAEIPYISNVTGTWITSEESTHPAYWAKHLREPVKFSQGLEELFKKSGFIFLEVGPGKALSTFVKQHKGRQSDHQVLNVIRHANEKESDDTYLLDKLGQLWLFGAKIHWNRFYENENRCRVPLPTYPFEGQQYRLKKIFQKISDVKTAASLKKKEEVADWFYIPSWERTVIPSPNNFKSLETCRFLVITAGEGLGAPVVEGLKRQGHDVATVGKGMETDEYVSLFNDLLANRAIPHKIIHMLGVTGNSKETPANTLGFAEAQESGFYSLLHLARAIGKLNLKQDIQINMVTDNMQPVTGEETLCPEKSTVLGLVKVLPQEYSNITCRSIDILLPPPGSLQEENLIRQLLAEFTIKTSDLIVAFRGNYRWAQSFKPVRFEKELEDTLPLKEKGVYLLIGGLGKMGLVLAKFLARRVHARLILTARSSLPPKEEWEEWLSSHEPTDPISHKIKSLYELEELGAEVLVKAADAADQKQMQEAISQSEQQLGPINGVVYAPGITDHKTFRFINDMDKTNCENHFQAKVYGLYTLERILHRKPLDFCLLTSSLASVLGGLGYSAYAAANLFMDAFVHRHNQDHQVQWISVNWDGWRFDREKEQPSDSKANQERLLLSLTPGEGERAFHRVLAWGKESQVVVSTGDLGTRLRQWIQLDSFAGEETPSQGESSPLQPRPEILTPYEPPENPLENTITGILQDFFGFEHIGRNDNFFDIGATSLDLLHLNNTLRERLDREMSVVLWFEYPTVSSLAGYLAKENPGDAVAVEAGRSEIVNRGQKNLAKIKEQLKKGHQ